MARTEEPQNQAAGWRGRNAYEEWIKSVGIPIHRGYFLEDARSVEVSEWEEREYKAAFVVLSGQEGVSETRVTELAPGQTTPPLHFALDEITYVLDGRGLTTIWAGDGPKRTFEWHKRSIFMIPRGCTYQLTNTQGSATVRLLHTNSLPMAMNLQPDPDFYLENGYNDPDVLYREDVYAAAKMLTNPNPRAAALNRPLWVGNFFPDMAAWDKLHSYEERGAGGSRVGIQFANSPWNSHMSVFPSRTYKKAHRHGPGVVIVIPSGEGYSIMWPEGEEKVVVPWHEASVFVPPNRWFHQHFNVGEVPARYLAFHPPGRPREVVADPARDQIEYPQEDPFVRGKFQGELRKIGQTTLMPEQCYADPDYKWDYADEDED